MKKCTQITFEASALLSLHLHRLLEQNIPLPDNLLGKTFLRQFFSLVKSNSRNLQDVDSEILTTFESNYLPCRGVNFQVSDGKNCNQMITYLVKEYAQNLEMHINSHFEILYRNKLRRLLKSWHMGKAEVNSLVASILIPEEWFVNENPHLEIYVNEHRQHASSIQEQINVHLWREFVSIQTKLFLLTT